MNTDRDHLDDAIDHVATRMTRIEDHDAALAARIVASLPERSPWLLHSWIPRLAGAMLAAGLLVLVVRPFDGRSADVLRPFDNRSTSIAVGYPVAAEHRTGVEPVLNVRRTIVEPPSNDLATLEDHEYSLRAIEAVAALSLDSLSPESLPEDAPLTVAPLAIADLPLTAETISPR